MCKLEDKIVIKQALNGWILEHHIVDDMSNERAIINKYLFSYSEDEVDGERKAFIELLHQVKELYGPVEQAFEKNGNIAISIIDGHEYEEKPDDSIKAPSLRIVTESYKPDKEK